MNYWLFRVGVAVALLFSAHPAVALEPLFSPCWSAADRGTCGEWRVGAHALYFTPMACPYTYAQTIDLVLLPTLEIARGRAAHVPCSASWGFRVFGNYVNECMFAGLSYQRLESTATSSVVADRLGVRGGGQVVDPAKATGQVSIEYQNVDVKVGGYVLEKCASTLYLYGNVRWIDLSHRRVVRETTLTSGATEGTREKSQLQGGAIGFGLGGEFDIGCNVGAFIDGNILGVIGNRSLTDVEFTMFSPGIANTAQEFYPSETCVIPELDFRIGVSYTYTYGCWTLVGEIGYELDYFWDASVFPTFISTTLSQGFSGSRPACEDLGFSGLFFGGHLVF